jgi:hypothetical protein
MNIIKLDYELLTLFLYIGVLYVYAKYEDKTTCNYPTFEEIQNKQIKKDNVCYRISNNNYICN